MTHFIIGPTELYPEIRTTLAKDYTYFRNDDFSKITKECMNKINALNLGYTVHTNAGKDNGIEEIRKIRRENREKRKKSSKQYLTWCKKCGHAWISMRKHQKLSRWKCARCGGSLGQKIWREGKENKITFSGGLN